MMSLPDKQPKIIKIPFLERFREPMLKDVKTMTSRTKIYGTKGNWFYAFDAAFVLDSVDTQPFKIILLQWQAEGCSSKEDLLAVWKQIHPRRIFGPNDLLFVHRFHRVGSRKA